MHVELIDTMGSDLSVVNSARVSFDKTSDWDIEEQYGYDEHGGYSEYINKLSKKDQKLISYLAKHNHFTPFTHVMITMRETVPIFITRQRFKHVVGFTYNEISRRYVDDEPEFYTPDVWRKRAENKKQGSSDKVIDRNDAVCIWYSDLLSEATLTYDAMIKAGVCPEQARMVLPQSMYTSYYVTGSLAAWARAYNLRRDPHAQKEIQDLASMWNEKIGGIEEMKHSWNALTNF